MFQISVTTPLDELPTLGVDEIVRKLAAIHGVATFVNEGWPRNIDSLLVDLAKDGAISGQQLIRLLSNHCKELALQKPHLSRGSPLEIAARTASTSYKDILPVEVLVTTLRLGVIPKDWAANIRTLPDEAPLVLLLRVAEHMNITFNMSHEAVWANMRSMALELRSTREFWSVAIGMNVMQEISITTPLDALPTVGVPDFVRNLAQRHGVPYKRTRLDDWVDAVTRMADDEVKPDPTDDLLVALAKSGVISGRQLIRLLGNQMNELEQRNRWQ